MFYSLSGTVAELLPYLAVIDCGGVGYACKTTHHTLANLKKGEQGTLYTYLNVGEGIFDLYGFSTQAELHSFRMLLGVSGVGPRAALALLSSGTPESLALAVVTEDEQALMAAPGIGKKIARRIILELKDQLAKEAGGAADLSGTAPEPLAPANKTAEAAQALAVLGYSGAEITQALKGIDTQSLPLEEIIRQSLKKMLK